MEAGFYFNNKKGNEMKYIMKLVVTVLAIMSLQVSASKPQLDVQLKVEKTDKGNVSAMLTFTNNGHGQQKILSWYTDLNEEKIFKIKRDGENVSFYGPHYKRPAATDKDFIKLKSGESLTKAFELTGLYDMSKTGNYEVSYDVRAMHLFGNKGQTKKAERLGIESLASPVAHLWLDGIEFKGGSNAKKPGSVDPSPDCVGNTCFVGRCDNAQKTDLIAARSFADQIAKESVAYLSSHSANNTSARYTSWFGEATPARYDTAVASFNAIDDAIENETITFSCKCNNTSYAYVYPDRPYEVFVCKSFWATGDTGTDSRGGVIIHEVSHFNVVAGTDDFVYGHAGARDLAISSPDDALNNADNLEYFTENTPYED
jgi:peptidyl-Lys metalloendopeptidase